jgi:phosphatidylglycerol lysyltransferase
MFKTEQGMESIASRFPEGYSIDMDTDSGERPQEGRSRLLLSILGPILVAGLFIVALLLLYKALRNYHYHDLVNALRSYSPAVIIAALAMTGLNYFVLTFYDVLALRYSGVRLAYRKTAFASFMSYVFSYNIGLSLFGSSALRYRFYSSWGVDGATIAKIVTFCVSTFWIGLAVMGGASLLAGVPVVGALTQMPVVFRLLGLVLVLAVLAYLGACATRHRGLHIKSFTLDFPRIGIALAQTVAASLDWVLAALVLYSLLPAGKPSFLPFVALFAVAQLAGATSHLPGGIGVFETVMVLSLSPRIPTDILFGALIVYRGVYYLAPLTVAIVAFLVHEAIAFRHGISKTFRHASRIMEPFVPPILSVAVFLSGAILLFSGATPGVMNRLLSLDPFLPLPVLELSHFASSLAGLALLVIADALRRRVDFSWYLALGLLAAGAVFSLLKGLDWEEACVMITVIALLVPSRRMFYRHAAVLSPLSLPRWLIAVGTVLAASVWLGLFSYKHVEYSSQLWWVFEVRKDAPRFLRAALGVGIVSAIVALRLLLLPVPRMKRESLAECEEEVKRVLAGAQDANANLSLLGDKFFFFSESRASFLMFGERGRTIVVMGNPVGDPAEFPALLWEFHEQACRQGVRVAWYEVSADLLPIFLEFGARLFKIGEEAIVDLDAFSLEGGRAKNLRPPRNKMIREGYSFEMLDASLVPEMMENLRTVSDEWLSSKNAREKGFSLGFFDERYLEHFKCAVVRKDGEIHAFANLWTAPASGELSIDLMRHRKSVSGGIMEYLFIEIMLWGREQGFHAFNLGVAPLSGVESRSSAPMWNKAVSLIFKNGEGIYNFQGLRAFKDKFNPAWSPVYIAVPSNAGMTGLALVAADIAQLVSRGNTHPAKAREKA